MRRYGLRDDQWERIKDLLPGRLGHVGVTARDNRLFVEGVLYRYRGHDRIHRKTRVKNRKPSSVSILSICCCARGSDGQRRPCTFL